MGSELDEITWSGEVLGVLFIYLFILIRKHNVEKKEQ